QKREDILKKLTRLSLEERAKIVGKKSYGKLVNEDEKLKKDPVHGVPPAPAQTSPIETANYGGGLEGASMASQDQDATDFILYAGITDPTQQTAIRNLVSGLKSANLWDKFYVIYPYVGNTADTQKWNLKDPRDEDAAFRITWGNVTLTHESNGVQNTGLQGVAAPTGSAAANTAFWMGNTHFNPNTHLDDPFSMSVFTYSRTNNSQPQMITSGCYSGSGYVQWGLGDSSYTFMIGTLASGVGIAGGGMAGAGGPGNTLGVFGMSRTSTTEFKGYSESGVVGFSTADVSGTTTDEVVYLGSRRTGAQWTFNDARQHSFDAIGSGLTEAEVADLTTIVVDFQTTLGRKVTQ
ncbi:MAG TPA: hypothetical protein DF712_04440, partial [Balneola sp.]|nr:hypothetical protein [Balneola sp.]